MPSLEQLLTPESRDYFGVDTRTVRTRLARMIIQDDTYSETRPKRVVDLAERFIVRRHVVENPTSYLTDNAREKVAQTIAIRRYDGVESPLRDRAKQLAIAADAIAVDILSREQALSSRAELMASVSECALAMIWIEEVQAGCSAVQELSPDVNATMPVNMAQSAHPMPV